MNMRKIIAVLSAALLLCAAIPMSALSVAAAPGDVIIDADFNDGMDGFNNFSVADGALVLDGTSDDWANSYAYANNIKPNTEYTVTLRVKADAAKKLDIKINNGWTGGTQSQAGIAVTTEWQEFTVTLDGCPALDQGAIFTIQAPTYKNEGTVYYIDYVKVVEKPREPGKIVNGDFETGDLSGWEIWQGTTISTDAYSGSYAANLKGSGSWGGMLNQNIPVEAGKTYKISMWVKVNAVGVNLKIVDGGASGTELVTPWINATEWTEFTWEVTPATDIIHLNFCGAGEGNAEDVLVDDVTVAEVKVPSFDGYITNGDFETGNATGWNLPQQGGVSAEAAHNGNYGIHIQGNGSWGGMLDQTITVEAGKTYVITLWTKVNATGANVQINDPAYTDDKGKHTLVSAWLTNADWQSKTMEFTPVGDSVQINFCGGGNGNAEDIYVDDIVVTEKKGIWSVDFNDGTTNGFNKGEAVAEGPNGSYCLKWSAPGTWDCTERADVKVVKPDTDYTVTFKAKGSVAGGMGITIQNGDWGAYMNGPSFNVTTEWAEYTLTFNSASYPNGNGAILFKFQDVGVAMDLYVDDIVIAEGLPEQPTGNLIVNGDFETGAIAPWDNLWGGNTVEMVAGYNSNYAMKVTANGAWAHVRQTDIAVKPNTDYTITLYAKDASDYALLIKDSADSKNVAQAGLNAGAEWTPITFTFNTGDNTSILFSFMSNAAGATCTVDDVVMFEGVPEQPVVEFTNGDFETGKLDPWINLYGSNTVTFVEGYESNYAMQMITPAADQAWKQVRQNLITVKPNTDYRLSAVVKNAQNMAFVIKEGNDAYDLTSHEDCIFPAGEDWQEVSLVFNTGENKNGDAITIDSICILVICYEAAGGSVTIDNIVLEEYVCEHEVEDPCLGGVCSICGEAVEGQGHAYLYDCDTHCINCGEETRPDATHSIVHVEAKAPGNCVEFGNVEYWYCEHCGTAWLDETLRIHTNQKDVMIGGNCVSDAEFPCQDGVCTGCGLPYAADEEHTYDDDYDATCNVCSDVREVEAPPVEIIYGDANGDGEISTLDVTLLSQYLADWDVTLNNEIAADANGDGEISTLDVTLLSQYLADWDVQLGPN